MYAEKKSKFPKHQIKLRFIFIIPFLFLSSCGHSTSDQKKADIIIRNATIYTVAATRSWAQALAVSEGRFVYVGTNQGVKDFIGTNTQNVDLEGRLLLPGFHDSHVHLVRGGVQLGQCNLSEAKSVGDILTQIKSYAKDNPKKAWIIGSGWDQILFPSANPSKSLLDSLVLDRPALFLSRDSHSAWVNSRALEIAGITSKTSDPERGLIERDPKTGEPTGTLREEAIKIIQRHIPEVPSEDYHAGLLRALALANSYGIVSLQDAEATSEFINAYSTAEREGALTARVRLAFPFDPAKDDETQVQQFLRLSRTHRSPHLNAGSIKLFIDGVFDDKGVALLDPYQGMSINDRNAYGKLNFDVERLNHLVRRFDSEGFQVHMHAIGDRAIRVGLDAIEYAHNSNDSHGARHTIAHLHLTHPKDIPRFQQLGVVANFQPFFPGVYDYHIELVEPLIGPDRFKLLYPIRSMIDSGAIVGAGSDWPVTTLNPLEAIEVAITRQTLGEKDAPALNPEQRVKLADIIESYTIRGAYVNFEEKGSGSIEVGKWADFIVLDKNLFEIPVYEIHKARVLWTFLEGKEVYRASDW